MNNEHTSDGPDIPASSLLPIEPFEKTRDDSGRKEGYTYGYDFDTVAVTALQTLKEDFGRQLELVSDRQNAMVQSTGIILAFASVLLIETIRIVQTHPYGMLDIISAFSLFVCCLVGIATIWEWKNWNLYTGFDSNDIIEAFNDWRFVRLYSLLLTGVLESYAVMSGNNYILRKRITYMVLSLLAGTVFTVVGMVIK